MKMLYICMVAIISYTYGGTRMDRGDALNNHLAGQQCTVCGTLWLMSGNWDWNNRRELEHKHGQDGLVTRPVEITAEVGYCVDARHDNPWSYELDRRKHHDELFDRRK